MNSLVISMQHRQNQFFTHLPKNKHENIHSTCTVSWLVNKYVYSASTASVFSISSSSTIASCRYPTKQKQNKDGYSRIGLLLFHDICLRECVVRVYVTLLNSRVDTTAFEELFVLLMLFVLLLLLLFERTTAAGEVFGSDAERDKSCTLSFINRCT